jgi:hypothetical protein
MPKVGKRTDMSGAEVHMTDSNLTKPPVALAAVGFLVSMLRSVGYAARFFCRVFTREIDHDDYSALSEAIHCCEPRVSWDILCRLKNQEAPV